MLFDINKIIEGEYHQGYFIMGIQKKFFDGISWDNFSKEELATFVHEYVHYLQDISTTQGVTQFLHQSKLFQMYMAIFQRNEVIKLPMNIEKEGVLNAFAQTELLSFYEGDNKSEKKFHHIDCIKLESEELIEEILTESSDFKGEKKINQVSIYYDEKDIPSRLGSFYICESMSYLIEMICFGAEKRKNEWPYNVCEKISECICPQLKDRPEIIVILCEFALMHEHSGLAFYEALDFMSKFDLDKLQAHDVIRILSESMLRGISKLNEANKVISESIDYLYPVNLSETKMANLYVKGMLEAGHNYRNGNPFFISELLFSKDPESLIKSWIDLFPFPLLLDCQNRELYGSFDGLSIMPVPLAIKGYYEYPERGCPLMEYCKYSRLGNVNDFICKNSPWKQIYNQEKCPFALYMMIYQLDKKQFEINK